MVAARVHQRRTSCATAAVSSVPPPPRQQQQPLRIAVIGGGFAGLAASYHLLAAARDGGRPVQLRLIDAVGLGAGGSGAAAGLLHPYTPRGKMLWRGLEAFQEALRLVEAAEAAVAAAAAAADGTVESAAPANAAADAAANSEGTAAPAASKLGVEENSTKECLETPVGSIRRPFVWRHGMLLPSRSAKQAADIARFVPADAAGAAATQAEAVTDAATLAALVPGLQPDQLLPAEAAEAAAAGARQQQQQPGAQRQGAVPPALGLMVHAGATLHPGSYMRALWLACQLAARQAGDSSAATLVTRPVSSLRQLQASQGPFDAVVVAAGAAVGCMEELQGVLPLDLCQGCSLNMVPGGGQAGSAGNHSAGSTAGHGGEAPASAGATSGSDHSGRGSGSGGSSDDAGGGGSEHSVHSGGSGYPAGAPSLLGSPYIAAHGSGGLVVGATKRYGLTAQQAFDQLSAPLVHDAAEQQAAASALLPGAQQLWPPLSGWQVGAVRAGVRALPVRGSDGAIPYAGRLPTGAAQGCSAGGDTAASAGDGTAPLEDFQQQRDQNQGNRDALPPCWVIGGLGARGLVYHAWLGRLVAAAVLAGSEDGLPPELLRWRDQDA